MIIGINGDIGSVLNDREGCLFFVSGVSNSLCEDPHEFQREIDLLLSQPKDLCLIYFSTISQYYYESPYVNHKIQMEGIIRANFEHFNIIRIGNIDFGTNPNTFLNFMRRRKEQNLTLTIRDEYRYMISKEQILLITDNLPLTGRNEICIFGQMRKIKDLI